MKQTAAPCQHIYSTKSPPAVAAERYPYYEAAGAQVCESTGVVVAPYMDYPQLLGVLLRLLGEAGDGGRKLLPLS